MELEKVKAVKSVKVCSLCVDSSHKAQDCPIMTVVQESRSDQIQSANWFQQPPQSFAPQSQHQYQPHPISQNYSPLRFPSNVALVPPKRSLEDTLLAPQPNPQVYQQQQQLVHNVSGDSIETTKAVITLRSGKEVPRPEISTERQTVASTSEVAVESDEAQEKPEEVSQELKKSVDVEAKTSKEYRPMVPYPHRLVAGQKNKYHTEIQKIFKQAKINIPLLDAIQQVPSYVKFLKDLCTVKRKLNVKKKAFLIEQVSALILSETPQKLRDHGSPTISIMIDESRIGRALLDLGSSVNLLPLSIYEQLGLGELKKTSIVLQLAERSVKTPIILGRPFLATSIALINCRSGVLKLTFGNMTLEMNVFNACKMPSGCDDSEVLAFDVIDDFDISELLSVFGSDNAFENDSPEQPDVFYETIPLSRELTKFEG
ncbi:uncharacterized protein LOC131160862 [Malania oleifera]|uniref:uncharacterized protein LOC131160862 n=1 Tax=Malania oleifera TaxID=397392 RepID=UPI0025AE26CB|nr:uncharacterized protein LOC131160862 [Malania oleifera]